MVEAVRASETYVYSNETTRRFLPEGFHLHTRHSENLKSHELIFVTKTIHKNGNLQLPRRDTVSQ
jgi:hypothetical protein